MEAQLTSGSRLGPYEILNELGAGGMGAVYKARDTRLGRTVAIKISSAEWSRRSETEARASATLNHPHICSLYDIGEQDGVGYLVMEYVEGRTLSARLKESPLKIEEAVRFGAQIADALAAAHTHGIVHRDLKPGNIMLSKAASGEASVKVLDFGLAKFEIAREGQESLTATNAVMGTLEYMSPEQLEGMACDSRSDIYSLGLVLYEMATGKRAFAEILRGGTPSIPGAPPQFAHIVKRCLEKDPSRRWQSALDIKLELESASISGERSGWGTRSPSAATALLRRLAPVAWTLAGAFLLWGGVVLLRPSLQSLDLSKFTLMPFAVSMPIQADPVWSPDGKSIAFFGNLPNYQGGIYVQPVGGDSPELVTLPPFMAYGWFRLFWSTDSNSIYFNVWYSPNHNVSGIWRVSRNGGEPTLVQAGAYAGAISPDGRTLAMFSELDSNSETIFVASPPGSQRRKYEPVPFVNESVDGPKCMAFSPDGKKLLVALSSGPNAQMWLLPWPAGKAKRVPVNLGAVSRFSWLPDSRHIVAPAGRRLQIVDVETGRVFETSPVDRAIRAVSISGTRMAYQSSLSRTDTISVPLGAGPVATLLPGASGASCSPAARQLAYVAYAKGRSAVWLRSLAEGQSRPVLTDAEHPTPGGGVYSLPVLSPDGQKIAFGASTEGGNKIFFSFVSNPAPVRLTDSPAQTIENRPTWSPDGNWIAFGADTLYKARVGAQGAPVALLRPGSMEQQPADPDSSFLIGPEWSPTGEWIAYLWGRTVLVSQDGGQQRELSSRSGPSAWSRDGKTLYQIRGVNAATLYAIDIATGAERAVRELGDLVPYPNNAVRLSLTSDGKDLIYSVNRPREEIWVMEGLRLSAWWRRFLPW